MCGSPGKVAVFGFMNPVCGVILSAVLLGQTGSLSVMSVAALVRMFILVRRIKKDDCTAEE